jgi:hypothetical protein
MQATTALLSRRPPLTLCNVYDPNSPDAPMPRLTTTALDIFNNCLLRKAITRGLPVLDFRLICTEAADYANEIEPGGPGGRKIAAGILSLVQHHEFSRGRTVVYRQGSKRGDGRRCSGMSRFRQEFNLWTSVGRLLLLQRNSPFGLRSRFAPNHHLIVHGGELTRCGAQQRQAKNQGSTNPNN